MPNDLLKGISEWLWYERWHLWYVPEVAAGLTPQESSSRLEPPQSHKEAPAVCLFHFISSGNDVEFNPKARQKIYFLFVSGLRVFSLSRLIGSSV